MFKLLVRFATRRGKSKIEEERPFQTIVKEHSKIPRLHLREDKFEGQTVLSIPRQRETTECGSRSCPKWITYETEVVGLKRIRHVLTKWNQMFPEGSKYQIV